MAGVDVDRMRRYIYRTNVAMHAVTLARQDTEARARGEHCGLCATNPQLRALHAVGAQVAAVLRPFGGLR